MIKTLIFDFGDVFINLDKQGTIERAKALYGFDIITEKKSAKNDAIFQINDAYEKGLISSEQFIKFYSSLSETIEKKQVVAIWNSLIKDFPVHRLRFIEALKKKNEYHLILLSNTNELHINYIKEQVPFYEDFKNCFDKYYLSHEIHLRKPNADIFEFVLNESRLIANECLFIDDTKQNTDTAKKLGIHTWNIDETQEDITNLFTVKRELF